MGRDWNRDDPYADAMDYAEREPDSYGECESCGSYIYKGTKHIEIDGIMLCNDTSCIADYIRENYLVEGE